MECVSVVVCIYGICPFCVCAECHDFVVFADNVLRHKLIILLQGIALYESYH